MKGHEPTRFASPPIGTAAVGVMVAIGVLAIVKAPAELTMGDVQRVLYVHISVAWLSLVGFVAMACCGFRYLLTRQLWWDHWSQSIGEVGWICSTLTLITGSLWAHAAWGTWWTWDPRLVTAFILWAFYSGNLLLRGSLEDPLQRARLVAVLTIIGVADVPLVVMATRWFRGIHPVSPEMEPAMHVVLVLSMIAVTAIMLLLLSRRRSQLQLEHRVSELLTQAIE